MRPTSKLRHSSAFTAKLFPFCRYLRPSKPPAKYVPIMALLATATLLPIHAQAALPKAIEAALSRADLTEADISIIVTAVGDKNASHLPAPIQVIDSSTHRSSKPALQPKPTANINADIKSNSQKTTQNNNDKTNNNHVRQQSTLITIEQRTIEKHEKKLHAYTDDPYTYQSLESIPTILVTRQKQLSLTTMLIMIKLMTSVLITPP